MRDLFRCYPQLFSTLIGLLASVWHDFTVDSSKDELNDVHKILFVRYYPFGYFFKKLEHPFLYSVIVLHRSYFNRSLQELLSILLYVFSGKFLLIYILDMMIITSHINLSFSERCYGSVRTEQHTSSSSKQEKYLSRILLSFLVSA